MRCLTAHRLRLVGTCILVLSCLVGCSSQLRTSAPVPLLNAALWVQHSAEYRALAQQTYQIARDRLDQALEDPTWTAALEQVGDFAQLPPAVILDVDETIMETTTYSALLLRRDSVHDEEIWSRWYKDVGGKSVPGAVEFCTYARERGVTVFYITNNQDYMREVVRRSLMAAGFPLDERRETLLTRMDASDKGPRRAAVAKEFRVLLLIGDDTNDFASGFDGLTNSERADLAGKYASHWGTKWIVLPNPMYGSWEEALFDYHLPDDQEERISRKIEALRLE